MRRRTDSTHQLVSVALPNNPPKRLPRGIDSVILIDVDGCRYVVLDAWHERDDQNALAPTENGPSRPAVPGISPPPINIDRGGSATYASGFFWAAIQRRLLSSGRGSDAVVRGEKLKGGRLLLQQQPSPFLTCPIRSFRSRDA